MVDYHALGERIRMVRRFNGMSQKDVAQKAFVSLSFFGNIERGLRVPSVDTLVDIANVLQISLDYLLMDSLIIKPPIQGKDPYARYRFRCEIQTPIPYNGETEAIFFPEEEAEEELQEETEEE